MLYMAKNLFTKAIVIKLPVSQTRPLPLFDFQLTFFIFRSKVKGRADHVIAPLTLCVQEVANNC